MARARKAATKKAPAKRKAAKKPRKAAKRANGMDSEPVTKKITGELKYRLKVAQLEWQTENDRVVRAAQEDFAKLLARKQRNDPKWKAAYEARREVVNEVIDVMTPKFPEGFAIENVDGIESTVRASHNPEGRGGHMT